jgi:hypothetical protein
MKRPDLQKLEITLPPHQPGRDRRVRFEADGTIVYPEEKGVVWDIELPREINGYQRDPSDPFRFTPLWPVCRGRHGIAVRLALCGCIEIILRCGNPKAPKFADRVKWEECRDCPHRVPDPAIDRTDGTPTPPCPPGSSTA